MATTKGNEHIRTTYKQAIKQRLWDVMAYHNPSETEVAVAYNNKNDAFFEANLGETIKWLNEDNERDCWVSLAEYHEHKLACMPIFCVTYRNLDVLNSLPTPSVITYYEKEYNVNQSLNNKIGSRQIAVNPVKLCYKKKQT